MRAFVINEYKGPLRESDVPSQQWGSMTCSCRSKPQV